MPFCHLTLTCRKPKNDNYLWKSGQYPAEPRHIGQHVKRRRFDLRMTAAECQKILGVDKGTLRDWEKGKHQPARKARERIARFLDYDPITATAK
jgi:DNA-binding transcriptional regulator YiaG